MVWDKVAACEFGFDTPFSEEFLPEGIECLVDADFLSDDAADYLPVAGSFWDDVLLEEVRAERLKEASPRPPSESIRPWAGLSASALVHATLFAALFLLSMYAPAGSGDSPGRVVRVHLIDNNPAVPEEEWPGSIDSAASVASLAERRRHVTSQPVERPPMESFRLVAHEAISGKKTLELEDVSTHTEMDVQETRHDHDKSAREDRIEVDSASKSDSVNSAPSTASSPRSMVPAAGAETADFRAGVLSAIEEAAFFPRKALTKGVRGQAVVRFTIQKSGSIAAISLVKPSGSGVLDEAALKIVERAAKRFPRFPEHIATESVSYVVPIVFKARSSAED